MSSSTSSSEPQVLPQAEDAGEAPPAAAAARWPTLGEEFKAIAVAVLALLAVEAWARFRPMKWDQARIAAFPAEAARLSAQPAPRVILLGNSLTWNFYDTKLIHREMAAAGAEPVEFFNAGLHTSGLVEWQYVLKSRFIGKVRPPMVAVINLSPGAAQDGDASGIRLSWLAEEIGWADLPALALDLPPEQFGGVLHCKLLKTPISRTDLHFATIGHLSPNWWGGRTWVNGTLHRASRERREAQFDAAHPLPPPTYERFGRLLRMGRENGVPIVVVALPVSFHYDLDPQIERVVREHGMTFLDLRHDPALKIPVGHYHDEWHLKIEGVEIYSSFVARKFPELIHRLVRAKP
jgi:hypothetical protein